MRTRLIAFSFVSLVSLVALTNSLAKTASCPCSPCKCSPCTCGGSGSKSSGGGGKHHDKEHSRDHHGGSSVGVGVSVDLSGVGQRSREADPFAAGGNPSVAHTQERHKPKTKEPAVTFDDIKLTGVEGKDQNMPPLNVSDDMLSRENDPLFTHEDFETLMRQYKQLREHFPGLPPPPENLDRFVGQMRIALDRPPRHFIQWLVKNPEELSKIIKAWGTQAVADDSYNNAIWKFQDLNKDKYDAIFDPEVRDTTLHEDFDATPEGKKLGDALWNANGALQDAWRQAFAKEGAGQSVQK